MLQRITLLAVLLTLLAACGGAPAAPAPAPTDVPAAAAPTSVPAATVAPTTAPVTSVVYPVTLTHDRGTVTLAQPAERIVVFSEEFTEIMIALDLAPVGVALWRNQPTGDTFTQLPYLDQPILGQPRYIDGRTPNLEVIAALQPDLILHHDYGGEAVDSLYASLSQIAPTVAYSGSEIGGWKRALQGIAQATDRVPQAEQIIATYDSRVAVLTAEMASVVQQSPEVTLLLSGVDSIGVFDQRFAIGGLMQTLGFRLSVPEGVSMAENGYTAISAEILGSIRADSVMSMRFGTDQVHLADPILATLPMPILTTEIYSGMGYTGPFAEVIYLEGFARAFRDHYLAGADVTSVPRTITHAMGVTEVPAAPQRVVVLDTSEVDNALALGASIVGAPVAEVLQYQGYLADQLDGISDIGTISEPNLEAILALKPDLILGSKQRYEAIYPQLSEIAPTVFVESLRVPWQQNFRLHAEALGKTVEAEALLAAYDQRVAELQATLGPERGETTISVIRFRPGQVRLYLKSSFIGYILQDVGLGRPASQDQDTFSAEITLEQIADVDADYLFITGYAQNDSELDTFLESPLWQTLGAVQNERAIDVDDDHWIAGLGVQAANIVDDDLERLVMP